MKTVQQQLHHAKKQQQQQQNVLLFLFVSLMFLEYFTVTIIIL